MVDGRWATDGRPGVTGCQWVTVVGTHEKSEMADKSAFVPVDAIGNHKNTDLDVDIDDELFGKKPPKATASVTKAATAPAPAPPSVIKAQTSPAPKPAAAAAPAAGKYQYKKSTTYQKAYAK
ncbi:Protein CBG13849 [Caenorhabditis briggsae]|uniref:Protein CBG13849 n=1 Tax=Caenorhabditis briggsae TaxID=6238 RepID=A8XIU8_CAEBR|nr:Protein CBG13849 [Caenorhabditis briggsae]CAP32573.2 Protein CBG13849 [Caenorhabditis briggsae]